MAELPLHSDVIPKFEIIPRKMVVGRNDATAVAAVEEEDAETSVTAAVATVFAAAAEDDG